MNENDFSGVKQLRRTRDGRIIAGVASGLGRYTGIDPNIIRVALAIASFFGGLGVGIYAIGWLLLPDEGKNSSIVQDLVDKNKDNPVWQDARSKAEQGWAKAEQSWSKATHQDRAPQYPTHQDPAQPYPAYQNPEPQYPTHQDPAQPYPATPAPQNTAPQHDGDSKPQA
ncbi:phage shock protein PspC (stress-responsive transcriptional regulator) [Streptosporangium album]|uniref:Phage shock protein PspC (Stress-responsive transcriptional regulator) n=1 Tax=Streptosporangium album TaxID=47479 RepID=A0A7W7RTX2_9ACTN|nr:PspC domain-containing protein [Streptosporangium album]MBB4938139.1 phage shock protein PspC (stress-responsive transcriptional regulator) [Streptosporangium album]